MPTEVLLELQEHDAAIDRIDEKLADLPEAKAVTAADVMIDDARRRLEELDATITGAERERSRIDAEIERIDARIESTRTKLESGNVTNPRELGALHDETEMLERQKRSREDEELEKMVALDDLKSKRGDIDNRLAELESELGDMRSNRDAVVAELESDRARHAQGRDDAAARIDAKLLEVYDRIRRRRGTGAARLDGNVCRSCNMTLTPQEMIEVEETDIPRCPSCEVILVPGTDAKAASDTEDDDD